MSEEQKNRKGERRNPNVVYALADYKQLVIQYRTTHAGLVRSLSFWRTTVLWLSVVTAVCIAFSFLVYYENRRQTFANGNSLVMMSNRVQFLSARMESWEQELKAVRAELEAKNEQVRQLEKNLSTASKKQAEKLLKDVEGK